MSTSQVKGLDTLTVVQKQLRLVNGNQTVDWNQISVKVKRTWLDEVRAKSKHDLTCLSVCCLSMNKGKVRDGE